MNKNFKKAVCFIAFSTVLLTSINVKATVIQDKKERIDIASGVQYVKIDRFTDNGFIDIDVIKLDSKNSFSSLTPLISKEGVSKRATISSMIENNQAVAGINGDFFEVTNYPMALGSLAGDGKVILTTPEAAYSRNSFYVTKDGKGGVGALNNDITVKIGGKTLYVNALNKVSKPYTALSILDSNWGQSSPGKNIGANNVELLIANGKVIDKRVGGTPMAIIPGTYVLTQVGENLNTFNIGDSVNINFGSYNNLMFSIGGGNILVKNGQVRDKLPTARAPRTAIGINKNNTEILLVTVDGRNNSSIGMGEKELAEFMRSIGAYNALNLDGGGSTTMGIKYSGDSKATVVNEPSDGSQRPVVSGVGIKTNAPIEEASYVKVTGDDHMFSGFSSPIKLEVFDKHHNKLNVKADEITVTSNYGNYSNGNFTPNKKGLGKINASYKNAKGSLDVMFHSEIKELQLDVPSLQLSNGKVHIFETIYGKDDQGYKKKIHASQVAFSISEGLGKLEGNKFTALEEGSGVGTVTANYYGVKRVIPVSVGSDSKNIFSFDTLDNISYQQSTDDKSKIVGSLAADEGQDQSPSAAINYSFAPLGENQVVTMNFNSPIQLGNASALGMYVFGDKQGSKITANFTDENGSKVSADLVSNVDFEGWKYIEINRPNGLVNTIALNSLQISLKQARAIQNSKIKFDNIVTKTKKPLDWSLAVGSSEAYDNKNYAPEGEKATLSVTALNKNGGDNSKLLAHLQNKNAAVIFNGAGNEILASISSPLKFNGNDVHNIKTTDKTAFVTLQMNNSGLRSANKNQWKPFINTINNKDLHTVVIMMQQDPEKIAGKKEKDLFFETLEEGIKNGKTIFLVIPGSSSSISMVDGYKKVTLSQYDPASLDIYSVNNNSSYVLTRMK